MAAVRRPLVGNYGERAVADETDPKLVNVLVESEQLDGGKDIRRYIQKRPGLAVYDDLSAATTDTGRGIFEWNGVVYSVVGDELFYDETDLGQLATSSGRVYFDTFDGVVEVETMDTETAGPWLLLHDGANFYAVDDENTILQKHTNSGHGGSNIPSTILPGIVVLDQYLFLASNGNTGSSTNINEIHNSNVGDATAWSGDFIVGEIRADKGVAIARYYNYIVSFNEKTIEFFYDAANASGTPLNRYEGVLDLAGVPAGSGNCVVNADNRLVWVGQSASGGRTVMMMDAGFQSKKISTHAIDEYLEAEGTNISNAYAYHCKVAGNDLYVLTLVTTAARTFVYDFRENLWYEWTSDVSDTEGFFTGMASTSVAGKTLVQDDADGFIYELDPETYVDTDESEVIKVEIHTERFDDNVQTNKFVHRLYPVCDFVATGTANLLVSWSDDDYTTFVSNRTLDLTNSASFLTRLGFFRRRSYRLQFQSNNRFRILAFDLDESHGYYAR